MILFEPKTKTQLSVLRKTDDTIQIGHIYLAQDYTTSSTSKKWHLDANLPLSIDEMQTILDMMDILSTNVE